MDFFVFGYEAKNLLLGGVDSLVVYDNEKVEVADLSTQVRISH